MLSAILAWDPIVFANTVIDKGQNLISALILLIGGWTTIGAWRQSRRWTVGVSYLVGTIVILLIWKNIDFLSNNGGTFVRDNG